MAHTRDAPPIGTAPAARNSWASDTEVGRRNHTTTDLPSLYVGGRAPGARPPHDRGRGDSPRPTGGAYRAHPSIHAPLTGVGRSRRARRGLSRPRRVRSPALPHAPSPFPSFRIAGVSIRPTPLRWIGIHHPARQFLCDDAEFRGGNISGGRTSLDRRTIPTCVGPYQVVRFLGQGGMGSVYLAHSPGGRPVAVKVVRPELAGQPRFRRRFAREVAAARAVNGAYTAPVVHADTDCEEPWLATVFVPGPSLWDAVRSNGPLSPGETRRLGAGLAEALLDIHAAGIVHRDLKPHNVLMDTAGPRVIDFGIAHVTALPPLTDPGALLGTPHFMSPEQITGSAPTTASDVFAFGLVLAFAAGERSPFGAGNNAELLYRIVHTPPDLRSLPDGLRALVTACLAKRPGQRPTPAELLDTLGRRADGPDGPGPSAGRRPPSPAPPPPPPCPAAPPGMPPGVPPETIPAAGPCAPTLWQPQPEHVDLDLARNAHAVLADGLTDALLLEAAGHVS
ncbi:serine/threonine-protein kinase [Streptomyces sp. NPDC006172]|uniref:serine/threonine-protein kinase n=1 Tax=Streptomyces sp. NPDC006172 TaxID=3154470 RepID=UPI00340A6593